VSDIRRVVSGNLIIIDKIKEGGKDIQFEINGLVINDTNGGFYLGGKSGLCLQIDNEALKDNAEKAMFLQTWETIGEEIYKAFTKGLNRNVRKPENKEQEV